MLPITFAGSYQKKIVRWHQESHRDQKDWLAKQEAEKAAEEEAKLREGLTSQSSSTPKSTPALASLDDDSYTRQVQDENAKHEARRKEQDLKKQEKMEAAALEKERREALAEERKRINTTCKAVEELTHESRVFRFPVKTPSLKAVHGDYYEGTMQDYGEEVSKAEGKPPMPLILPRKKHLLEWQATLINAKPDTDALQSKVTKGLVKLEKLLKPKQMDGVPM